MLFYEILTPNIYEMSPVFFPIENILTKHVEYFKYIEKKRFYIENINTLNSDMAMYRYVFTLFILFLIVLNFSLATFKVALQNVLCVAQRGKLQHLLR